MRKLIAFFQRFRVFLVFTILQLIALGSYFSIVSYPRTKFFNTSTKVVGAFLNFERSITKYIYLEEANEKLQEENKKLRKRLPESYISIDQKRKKINDTIYKLSYEYIPATVINSVFSRSNNYFTINAGSLKGIKPKMGVVSNDGAVGIVYSNSDHYSVVKSILTSDINLSAFVEGVGAHGLVKYETLDPRRVTLTGVSNDIKIKRNANVLAKGSGGYFPANTPIGIVEKLEVIEGKPLWDITVRLNQDMRKLHYVFVIDNILQGELKELEGEIEELN